MCSQRKMDNPLQDQVEVFCIFWAVAHIAHLIGGASRPLTWLVVIAALLVLHNPRKAWRMGVLAVSQLIYLYDALPNTPNHTIIVGAINLGLLFALVYTWIREKDITPTALSSAFPYIRVSLLVAYGAAAIAKLNEGFFNPEVSCAVSMFYESYEFIDEQALQISAKLEGVLPFAIAGVELLIPVLLLIRRTRVYALVLLVPFHVIITITPSSPGIGFTPVLFALVLLFLPVGASTRIKKHFKPLLVSLSDPVGRAYFLMVVGISVDLLLSRLGFYLIADLGSKNWFWVALTIVVMGALLLEAARYRGDDHGSLKVHHPVYVMLLAIVVLNAASPYLGGKTISSFTMFSNLQTEEMESNHYFIPRLPVATSQDDLVRLVESSDMVLNRWAHEEAYISRHELKRRLAKYPETSVTFEYEGEIYEIDRAKNHPDLVTTHYWKHRFIGHRPVDPGEPTCRW